VDLAALRGELGRKGDDGRHLVAIRVRLDQKLERLLHLRQFKRATVVLVKMPEHHLAKVAPEDFGRQNLLAILLFSMQVVLLFHRRDDMRRELVHSKLLG
jgi:hypothetical protein